MLILRHPHLLLAVALSPSLVGCAIDPGAGGSEPASQSSQALGGPVHQGCTPYPWSVTIDSVVAYGNGDLVVQLCVPAPGNSFNVGDTPLNGPWQQWPNKSGRLDLYGMQVGNFHAFQAQSCWGGNVCSNWTPQAWIYNPFVGTTWLDLDQVKGTAAYANALATGNELGPDGQPRPINTCAVRFTDAGGHMSTQVGKASASSPGLCWFGYGGGEPCVSGAMVLQNSTGPTLQFVQWRPNSVDMGPNPVAAGYEPGNTEYICHAPFWNKFTSHWDILPGKTVGGTCNISWGGQEIAVDHNTGAVEVLNAL